MKKAITIIIAVLALAACSKKEVKKTKNLEQIYAEQGIPVKVKTVSPQNFSKTVLYNAPLRGIKQSTEFAMVSDRVEKVHVKVGQKVEKDQVVISFPTDNPSASYKQAKAAFKLAKDSFNRMKALYAKGGISKQDLDQAETQYKVNKANLNSAKKMLVVKAPFAGIISQINVVKTQNVKPGDALFTIANTKTLKAKAWVNEEDISNIKKGTKVDVSWLNNKAKAKVTDVALAMNTNKKAFAVEIEVDNTKGLFKAGVTADFAIITYSNKNAIVVDREVVVHKQGKPYVWVANSSKAKMKAVEIANENSSSIEIKSGLNINENVIVEGYNIVSNGSKLNIVK